MTLLRPLLLIFALVVSAPSLAAAANIDVADRCYANGEKVVIEGDGFAADGPVTFSVNGRRTSGTVITDSEGAFSAEYEPPASDTETKIVIRATDSSGATAKVKIFVTRERRVIAVPDTTSNVRTWKAVFKLYGFGRGKAFIHYIAPNGQHRKTVKIGKLKGACGRLKSKKRRVLPFKEPAYGVWRLQFDTRRRFSRNTASKRVIPVRVFRA